MNEASLPRNFLKFCPHCGSPCFTCKSEKEFRCEACGFDFFTNSACAVAAIIVKNQQIMLVRRAVNPWKGMLDLPGGFVDPGEGAEEALRRELKEELGIEVSDMRYYRSAANRYLFSNYMVMTTDLSFIVEVDAENFDAKDDIDSIEWYDINAIPLEKVAAESIRKILAEFQQNHQK